MINLDARRERHAKLKDQNLSSLSSKTPAFNSKQGVSAPLRSLFKKVASLVGAFLILMPFLATFQLTYGNVGNTYDYNLVEFTDQNSEFTIADVMTEDGFLLKPAISSDAGDRVGFSDIFVYTVETGDTLSSIAKSFNLKKETLMAENNIWNPNRLKVGSKIKILPVDGLSHSVKKGESLDKIAKKYKVAKEAIIKQNQLDEKGVLVAKQLLIIPGAKRQVKAPVYSSEPSKPSVAVNYSGPKANGRLIWPTTKKAILTQGYNRSHLALDIANRAKGPIYAAAAGKVIKARGGWNGGYGNMIIIDHGNGMKTLYAHNGKLYVTPGQYVEQGQTIAWMGNSGRVRGVTGIHVHFEVRIKGVKYNPFNFF